MNQEHGDENKLMVTPWILKEVYGYPCTPTAESEETKMAGPWNWEITNVGEKRERWKEEQNDASTIFNLWTTVAEEKNGRMQFLFCKSYILQENKAINVTSFVEEKMWKRKVIAQL